TDVATGAAPTEAEQHHVSHARLIVNGRTQVVLAALLEQASVGMTPVGGRISRLEREQQHSSTVDADGGITALVNPRHVEQRAGDFDLPHQTCSCWFPPPPPPPPLPPPPLPAR